jgi:cytochrome c oxidase subunit IV
MGMKSTAGSLGNMVGPALVVILVPYLLAQQIFAISLLLVLFITLLAGLILRVEIHSSAQRLPVRPSPDRA